ncbi:YhdP family phospholipid transporter [Veronia nyctiphanis]|uniref:YhdP family phospholipid transporter n=1 Tax=Veronia nyctiphanis TaxID=1278244 RepID=UPI001375ED9B|nr:AsmA-like C-terminal region-containing protein [Veronia nyctiphanis]
MASSVGNALTYLGLSGPVKAGLSLTIPLDGEQVKAVGAVKLANNSIKLSGPTVEIDKVSGQVLFENDRVSTNGLSGMLLGQKIELRIDGEQQGKHYELDIRSGGNWLAEKLLSEAGLKGFDYLKGNTIWTMNLVLGIFPQTTQFLAELKAPLSNIKSGLPAPLDQTSLAGKSAKIIVEGTGKQFTAIAELPDTRYRGVVSLSGKRPKVVSSFFEVGNSSMPVSKIGSHLIDINYPSLDIDSWKYVIEALTKTAAFQKPSSTDIPSPTGINLRADKLDILGFSLNNVNVAARNNKQGWNVLFGSKELDGNALWHNEGALDISVDHLFVNHEANSSTNEEKRRVETKASAVDKLIMKHFPNTSLVIEQLWLQGYRVGRLKSKVSKSNNRLNLTTFSIDSGDNMIDASGWWEINNSGKNHSRLAFNASGADTADIMGRFGVTGGIQKASYTTIGDITFDGTPWAPDTHTMDGDISAVMREGYISGVGGAGKLLGLFSLDSIVRKMQLDFRGVFEDGLAFDEISGRGVITDGVVVTDNIQMKALAGDMFIKGIANLPENRIDADVKFIPDITSSIPVLSAFAVAPQTALIVAAATTVLSPVVDVFTQVRYQVSGTIDAPVVKEVSRSQAEMTLPKKALERLRSQQGSE